MLRLALAILILLTLPLRGEQIVAGLSQGRVSITADFDGSEILVFGAVKHDKPPAIHPPLEVIITVEGPRSTLDVRKKMRLGGIWVNRESTLIDNVPAFYSIATTGPLFGILSHTADVHHGISIPRGIRAAGAVRDTETPIRFTDALIRLRMRDGLYKVSENSIVFSEQTLFRTSVALPANLTEGIYKVRIFLTRDREILDYHTTYIDVRKVGLERFLHNLAHKKPALYGLLSIVLAALAGWGASALFRYIRL